MAFYTTLNAFSLSKDYSDVISPESDKTGIAGDDGRAEVETKDRIEETFEGSDDVTEQDEASEADETGTEELENVKDDTNVELGPIPTKADDDVTDISSGFDEDTKTKTAKTLHDEASTVAASVDDVTTTHADDDDVHEKGEQTKLVTDDTKFANLKLRQSASDTSQVELESQTTTTIKTSISKKGRRSEEE